MSYGRGFVGSKYTGFRDAAEVARDVRVDLKAAAADKGSPLHGRKFSVRVQKYSMGQSIAVTVLGMPDADVYEDVHYGSTGAFSSRRFTRMALDVFQTARDILEAYNRDNSDPMTDHSDVMFYGNVDIESDRTRAYKAQEKARKAAK